MHHQPWLIKAVGSRGELGDYQHLLPSGIYFPLEQSNPDIKVLEPGDRQHSIGVAETRQLTTWLELKPFQYPFKLAVIISADKLTVAGQNSLLKSLEEPADNTLIWLFASNLEILLPTLRSRCRQITGKAITSPDVDHSELENIANLFTTSSYIERTRLVEEVPQKFNLKQQQLLITLIMRGVLSLAIDSNEKFAMISAAKMGYKALSAGVSPKLTWETLGISIDTTNS